MEPLFAVLQDRDHDIQRAAAEAIDSTGWQPADNEQRAYLAIAKDEWEKLFDLGEAAVNPLFKALGNHSHKVREMATEVLGNIALALDKDVAARVRKGLPTVSCCSATSVQYRRKFLWSRFSRR